MTYGEREKNKPRLVEHNTLSQPYSMKKASWPTYLYIYLHYPRPPSFFFYLLIFSMFLILRSHFSPSPRGLAVSPFVRPEHPPQPPAGRRSGLWSRCPRKIREVSLSRWPLIPFNLSARPSPSVYSLSLSLLAAARRRKHLVRGNDSRQQRTRDLAAFHHPGCVVLKYPFPPLTSLFFFPMNQCFVFKPPTQHGF